MCRENFSDQGWDAELDAKNVAPMLQRGKQPLGTISCSCHGLRDDGVRCARSGLGEKTLSAISSPASLVQHKFKVESAAIVLPCLSISAACELKNLDVEAKDLF
jgi:hypothetical protein